MIKRHNAPLNLACFVVYSAGLRLRDKGLLSLCRMYKYCLFIVVLKSYDIHVT